MSIDSTDYHISVMELKCIICQFFEPTNTPEASDIFWALMICRHKIKAKVTTWYHLEVSEKELVGLLHQAHLRQVRQQLADILAKNQFGLLTDDDAEELSGIADELISGKISKRELGFTAESLQAIIACIREGRCYQAVAVN